MLKRSGARWLTLAIFIFFVDWLTKYYIVHNFALAQSKTVLPFLNLMLAHNKGTAFSLMSQGLSWQFWLLTGLAIVISVLLTAWLFLLPRYENWKACALALILGGAVGNLWDRITLGHVIDFVDFHIGHWHFATFNIADAAITIGAIMLILEMLFCKK